MISAKNTASKKKIRK